MFWGSFKGSVSVFQENLKKKLQGCFKEDWGVFLDTFKGDSSRLSKRSSKGVKRELRQVQRCFEEVSKKVLACFKTIWKKLQGCFKNVSMKFCLTNFLLHGSHRSYPSRRRACFLLQIQASFSKESNRRILSWLILDHMDKCLWKLIKKSIQH